MKFFTVLCIALICSSAGNTQNVYLSSAASQGGEEIYLQISNKNLEVDNLSIAFAGVIADIIAIAGDTIKVLVPNMSPGIKQLQVRLNTQIIFTSSFKILPPFFKRVSYLLKQDQLFKIDEQVRSSLNKSKDYNFMVDRLLSYEALDKDKNVITSGFVNRQVKDFEVFSSRGTVKRTRSDTSEGRRLDLYLPSDVRPTQLQIYGNDTSSNKSFTDRVLVYSFKL